MADRTVNGMELPSAADVLKVQLRHAWVNSRWVLEDLGEDEYFWEPGQPCWSVRRRGLGVSGWGRGQWVCEDGWPPPEPVPITTAAWRIIHLAAWTDIYRDWTFGDATALLVDYEVPGDRDGGLAWLYSAQDGFTASVDALGDEEMFDLRPAHWGEMLPVVHLVTSMLTEHVHHIAEVRSMFGWVQLVRSSDFASGGARFEVDPFVLFGDARSPYCWYGTEPTLFDAPSRFDRSPLAWACQSYLAATPIEEVLKGQPRRVVPIIGFGWGFDVLDDGSVELHDITGLRADDWQQVLPVLRAEYPSPLWTFAEML